MEGLHQSQGKQVDESLSGVQQRLGILDKKMEESRLWMEAANALLDMDKFTSKSKAKRTAMPTPSDIKGIEEDLVF